MTPSVYFILIFELEATFGLLEVTCLFCTAGINLLIMMMMMIINNKIIIKIIIIKIIITPIVNDFLSGGYLAVFINMGAQSICLTGDPPVPG